MKYSTSVKGSQAVKPSDFETNGRRIYARANIEQYTEEMDGQTVMGWTYDEVILSDGEYGALRELNTEWVTVWSAALRCAERRARYERIDPIVSSIRRKIDLGIDTEANQEKLLTIQTYCKAVTDTQESEGFPLQVTYPDEPSV